MRRDQSQALVFEILDDLHNVIPQNLTQSQVTIIYIVQVVCCQSCIDKVIYKLLVFKM